MLGLNKKRLFEAVQGGNIEIVEELLKPNFFKLRKVNIDAKDKYGNTPLHYASCNGYVEIVKMLIEKGVVVNAINKISETPLHWSTSNKGDNVAPDNLTETTKILIEKKANLNARNQHGANMYYFL